MLLRISFLVAFGLQTLVLVIQQNPSSYVQCFTIPSSSPKMMRSLEHYYHQSNDPTYGQTYDQQRRVFLYQSTGDNDNDTTNDSNNSDSASRYGYGNESNDDETNNKQKEDEEEPIPNQENLQEPLKTISGGTSEIFSMARRMMVWNEDFGYPSDASSSSSTTLSSSSSVSQDDLSPNDKTSSSETIASIASAASSTPTTTTTRKTKPLPRWHPHEGIADSNPSFRSKPPLMNNKGYAMLIRRNSRKRNKQSLWRHAYRTYNKMKSIEEEQKKQMDGDGTGKGKGKVTSKLLIVRHVIHFEAALVSCAKLGLWREALSIYQDVVNIMEEQKDMDLNKIQYVQTTELATIRRRVPKIIVTDNIILSLVSACVKGAKCKVNHNTAEFDKREPLDAARDVLLSMEERYDIPLVSRHINRLAAAYQHIGLYKEGVDLIDSTLADRKTQAQDKEDDELASFNINDVQAKDAASYNILIQGAITEGDWASAIGSLRDMTDKGLYPESRSLNCWSETARKRERRAGSRKTTWKKNRERLITGTLPVTID
jgi:hypothetical protein